MATAADRSSLRKSGGVQLRVLGALLIREMLTRYGRHNIGFLWLLLIKNKLNDFLTTKGVWLIPASLVIVGAGLLSGHRYTVVIIVLVFSSSRTSNVSSSE